MLRARKRGLARAIRLVGHAIVVSAGAILMTLLVFLVLPVMETIGKPPEGDLLVQPIDTASLPPPPPPVAEEPPEEPEEEEKPPVLQEDMAPLDLSQLELALNTEISTASSLGGDVAVRLVTQVADAGGVEDLFSIADLDQPPRAVYQPSPMLDRRARAKAPGTAHVLFVVDQRGSVENPVVQKSTDPVFDRPALAAVKQWKFEPGKRKGQPVRFRMRVPIVFPGK